MKRADNPFGDAVFEAIDSGLILLGVDRRIWTKYFPP